MTAGLYRRLFEYNAWANARILNRVAEVPAADYFATAAGLSFGSLHATLVHILVPEVVWLARWQGAQPPGPLADARQTNRIATNAIPDFGSLRALWTAEEAKQRAFYASLDDADLTKDVTYHNQQGLEFTEPLEQLILHVVNHGTQFRAEAAVRLSQLGLSPGDLDLIVFMREQP